MKKKQRAKLIEDNFKFHSFPGGYEEFEATYNDTWEYITAAMQDDRLFWDNKKSGIWIKEKHWSDDIPGPVQAILTAGAFAVVGILGTRIYKKHTLAADIQSKHPDKKYGDCLRDAMNQLDYLKHPFKI